jgi:hypothetical protein
LLEVYSFWVGLLSPLEALFFTRVEAYKSRCLVVYWLVIFINSVIALRYFAYEGLGSSEAILFTLVEVGNLVFDVFVSSPMLWESAQHRL